MEGTHRGSANDSVRERVQSRGIGVSGFGLSKLLEEQVLLCELLENPREVFPLLGSSLCRWGVVGSCEDEKD